LLHFPKRKFVKSAFAAVLAMTLAACGGEGSSEVGVRNDAAGNDAAGPAELSTLSGVAALGAPIAQAQVDCRCASGASASTVTGTDGGFRLRLMDSDYPCALAITGGVANGQPLAQPLHSVASAAGTANITPLTDLMVASMSGQRPALWLAGATQGELAATITDAKLARALDGLHATLASLPAQAALPAGFHPMTSRFNAQAGDAADDLLESYSHALKTAGLTHVSATARVAAGETLAAGSYAATVITTPGLRTFRMSIFKDEDGRDVLHVPDPLRGTKTAFLKKREDDAITGLESNAHFDAIRPFFGNLFGILGSPNSPQPEPLDDMGAWHWNLGGSVTYAYISDEMVEVDPKELLGRTFKQYSDASKWRYFTTIRLDQQGNATITDPREEEDPYVVTDYLAPFQKGGWEEADDGEVFTAHAKAFRFTTLRGEVKYAIVTTIGLKNPKSTAFDTKNEEIWMAVSQ